MKGQKIRNGDIVQIPLPHQLGFAYGKYIDLLLLDKNGSYPCLLLFYNFIAKFPLKIFDELDRYPLILCPHLIGGVQPTINRNEWTIVDNYPPTLQELFIPDYKMSLSNEILSENSCKDWYLVKNLDVNNRIGIEYSKVKHLEEYGATSASLVSIKLAMAFLKDSGKSIEDYFQLKHFYEKSYYNQVTEIPAYYKQSDLARGRAL